MLCGLFTEDYLNTKTPTPLQNLTLGKLCDATSAYANFLIRNRNTDATIGVSVYCLQNTAGKIF